MTLTQRERKCWAVASERKHRLLVYCMTLGVDFDAAWRELGDRAIASPLKHYSDLYDQFMSEIRAGEWPSRTVPK